MTDVPVCIEEYIIKNNNLVIRDISEFQNILDNTCYIKNYIELISFYHGIDFDENSLLGFYVAG